MSLLHDFYHSCFLHIYHFFYISLYAMFLLRLGQVFWLRLENVVASVPACSRTNLVVMLCVGTLIIHDFSAPRCFIDYVWIWDAFWRPVWSDRGSEKGGSRTFRVMIGHNMVELVSNTFAQVCFWNGSKCISTFQLQLTICSYVRTSTFCYVVFLFVVSF